MQKLRDAPRVSGYWLFALLLGATLGAWIGFSLKSVRLYWLLAVTVPCLYLCAKRGGKTLMAFLFSLGVGVSLFAIALPVKTGRGNYEGIVIESKANYFLYESEWRRYYVYSKDSVYETGDILEIKGNIAPYETTEYESRFSFKEYLRSKGVTEQLYASAIAFKFKRPLRLREKERAFLSSFDPNARALLDSALFAHADYRAEVIQKAACVGCLYFLSYGGVFYGGFLRLSDRLFGLVCKEKESHAISWLFASLLLPFSLSKLGVWRIYLSRSYRLLLEWQGKKAPPNFFVLSALGCLTLLGNRFAALNTGFLIGYWLPLALGLSGEYLRKFPGKNKEIATSLFVLIFLLPVLVSGNAVHLFSGLYSLLLLPLVGPFAFLGGVSFVTTPLIRVLNGYAGFLSNVVDSLTRADFQIPLGDVGEPLIFIYYGAFCLYMNANEIGWGSLKKALLASLGCLIALNVVPLGNGASGEVCFLNVGQGDAILIRDGYTAVMIDTGGNLAFDMAQEVDIPYLRKKRIYHLDCLIASHGDFDHIGAGASLLSHFPVRRYVDSASSFPLTLGNLTFRNFNSYGGSEENMESLVLSLRFLDKTWLFTGDAPIEIEQKILADNPRLDCDVLKVGHHGSKTSSSLAFLRAITPSLAIISVGKKNRYGHPDAEVIERLRALKIPIRRTDEEGSIQIRQSFLPFQVITLPLKTIIVPYDSSSLFLPIPDGPRRFEEALESLERLD